MKLSYGLKILRYISRQGNLSWLGENSFRRVVGIQDDFHVTEKWVYSEVGTDNFLYIWLWRDWERRSNRERCGLLIVCYDRNIEGDCSKRCGAVGTWFLGEHRGDESKIMPVLEEKGWFIRESQRGDGCDPGEWVGWKQRLWSKKLPFEL